MDHPSTCRHAVERERERGWGRIWMGKQSVRKESLIMEGSLNKCAGVVSAATQNTKTRVGEDYFEHYCGPIRGGGNPGSEREGVTMAH